MQHNGISQSSCESRGVVNNTHEVEDRSPEKVYEKVGERYSYPQGTIPSAAWLAQSNKVDEAIQCDMSWWQGVELARSPEQMALVKEGSSSDCTTKGSRKKSRKHILISGQKHILKP